MKNQKTEQNEKQEFTSKCNSNELFDWNVYLQTQRDKVSLDISQQGITDVSDVLKCPYLEYLYIEGNDITELGLEFFPSLRRLKWLDVRNNKLKSIPSTILDHPSLQVLLLEGNQIESLPVEIGSLKSLRGIQLARNPLMFPPASIVNQGVSSTIDYLRRQWQMQQSPQHIQLISESHSPSKAISPKAKLTEAKKHKVGTCKSATSLKVNGHVLHKPRNSLSGSRFSTTSLSKCISVRPISHARQRQHQLAPVSGVRSNWCNDEDSDEEVFHIMNCERKSSTQRKKSLPTFGKINRTNPVEEVQPKQLRDIWIEKIRQLLITQETILQRRKNSEALKEWQDEAKILQQSNPKTVSKADINFPYDFDPEYQKMISRKDLTNDGEHRRKDSSSHHTRHEEPINSKIMSIMAALQELQQSQSVTSVSPRSEQRALAQEIIKIKEIQRSLNALKLKNFGQLSLTS